MSFKNCFFSIVNYLKSKQFLKHLLVVVFAILIFFYSGYTFSNSVEHRTYFNAILVLFTFILVISSLILFRVPNSSSKLKQIIVYYLKQARLDFSLFFLIYFIFIELLAMLVNRDFTSASLSTFATTSCIFISGYILTKVISLKNFAHYYKRIFPFICLVSLMFFALINAFNIKTPFNTFSTSIVSYDNFFLYFNYHGLANRNCGIFWEPALFSLFICLGIVFELVFVEKKIRMWALGIYGATLVTTFSISGFAIALVLLFPSILIMKGEVVDKNFRRLIITLVVFWSLVFLVYFLKPQILDKLSFGSSRSFVTRITGPYINIRIMLDHPFGVGFTREHAYFLEYSENLGMGIIDSQTCAFGYWLSSCGFGGLFLLLTPLIILVINKNLGIVTKLFLLPLIFLFMVAEPIQFNLVFVMFIFYCTNTFKLSRFFKTNENAEIEETSSIYERLTYNRNNSIFFKNSLGAFFIKGLALFVSLFTTSAYITYFADPRGEGLLAVWFTILSILTWILIFDLGIGHGLKNKLINCYEKNDVEEAKKLISSAYVSSALISLLILVVGSILVWTVDVYKIFNINSSLVEETKFRLSLFIILLSICLNFVLKIISNIFESRQKQGVANFFAVGTTILILLYVLLFNLGNNSDRLLGLAFAYLFASTVPYIIGTIILFSTSLKEFRFSLKDYSFKDAKLVVSLGGLFFIIQICMLIINNTNTFIIQYFYNLITLGATAQFTYYQKIYNIVIVVSQLIAGPLWVIVTKSASAGDGKYISKMNKILFIFIGIFVFIELLVFALLPIVFDIWIPNAEFTFSWLIDLVFAVTSMLVVASIFFTAISNGLSKLRYQIIGFAIGMVLKVISIVLIVIFLNKGVQVPWYFVQLTTLLAYIPVCILVPIGNHIYLKRMVVGE